MGRNFVGRRKAFWISKRHQSMNTNISLEFSPVIDNSLYYSYRAILYIQGADHTYRMLKKVIAIMRIVTLCKNI